MDMFGLVWRPSVKTVYDLAALEPVPYEARLVEYDGAVYVCGLNGKWWPLTMNPSIETRNLAMQIDDQCLNANEWERRNVPNLITYGGAN